MADLCQPSELLNGLDGFVVGIVNLHWDLLEAFRSRQRSCCRKRDGCRNRSVRTQGERSPRLFEGVSTDDGNVFVGRRGMRDDLLGRGSITDSSDVFTETVGTCLPILDGLFCSRVQALNHGDIALEDQELLVILGNRDRPGMRPVNEDLKEREGDRSIGGCFQWDRYCLPAVKIVLNFDSSPSCTLGLTHLKRWTRPENPTPLRPGLPPNNLFPPHPSPLQGPSAQAHTLLGSL